jgi:hypothetical protein
MKKFLGNHIVVLKNQLVMAASEIEAMSNGVAIRFGGTETLIRAEDIAVVYETGEIDRIPIDPAILSTLATLESGIRKYEKSGGRRCPYTICGGVSLALTLIPNRTTEDIDVVAREPIEEFLSRESLHWDYSVEFLDETTLALMGDWQARTSTAVGPTGMEFRLMHPLDTIMQKLLRWSGKDFAQRDWPDIRKIVEVLQPTEDTLKKLLTENPFRYAKGTGPMSVATDAIEGNTRAFIEEFLPDMTYESLAQLAFANLEKKLGRAHVHPLPIPNVDLSTKIRQVPLDLG